MTNIATLIDANITLAAGVPATILTTSLLTFPNNLILVVAAIPAIIILQKIRYGRRRAFIETYQWPPGSTETLQREFPHLTPDQIGFVDKGLRQFFLAYLTSGRRYVSMPSAAADELWHTFILHTREYDRFCRKAFGRFLHHRPASVLRRDEKQSNEGLRRVWWHTCKLEGINPETATALPLLFALDRDLAIPNGFVYHADCEALRRQGIYSGQCGGDFISISFDGTTDGMGDNSAGDGGDGGDGGGCGGD